MHQKCIQKCAVVPNVEAIYSKPPFLPSSEHLIFLFEYLIHLAKLDLS